MSRGGAWFDDEAGPLVRPYALTRGRTRSGHHELNMITLVVAIRTADELVRMEPEHAEILRMCEFPLSVAEISARLDQPLAVVKVLISDLIEHRCVIYRSPPPPARPPDQATLQAVLDGIRKL